MSFSMHSYPLSTKMYINPNRVDTFNGYFKIKQLIQHGIVTDRCIDVLHCTNLRSVPENARSLHCMSEDLYNFLDSWGEFNILSPKRMNGIELHLDNIKRKIEIVNPEEINFLTYSCNARTVYKDLTSLLKFKKALEKMGKKVPPSHHKISYNKLITAALCKDKEYGLHILRNYPISSVESMANSTIFKHRYKLVHPDTEFKLSNE